MVSLKSTVQVPRPRYFDLVMQPQYGEGGGGEATVRVAVLGVVARAVAERPAVVRRRRR